MINMRTLEDLLDKIVWWCWNTSV